MAYDITALVDAIAKGQIDETQGKQLINQEIDTQIGIAKILAPKPEQPTEAPVQPADQPATQPEQPAQTADLSAQPADQPAQ